MALLTAQEAVIGGSDGIYKSLDGGKSWLRYRLPSNPADSLNVEFMNTKQVCFTSAAVGFAAGWNMFNYGMILKTSDGGIHWEIAYKGPQLGQKVDISFRAMTFVNQLVGYVAGTKGVVLKTVDAGETWSPVAVDVAAFEGENSYFNSVFFLDEAVGYVAGAGLYRT